MFRVSLSVIRSLLFAPDVRGLALENLALRQQLVVMKRKCPRPFLRRVDRLLWVWLAGVWRNWRQAVVIVKPETVVNWHRQDFRLFWTWISRRRRSGRPSVNPEVRDQKGVTSSDGDCDKHRICRLAHIYLRA